MMANWLERVAERKPALRRALRAWYRRGARDLPWRRTRDPYRIWLSEIMLQQTRVETVIGYYRRFLREFPGVGALAKADPDRVLKLWEGLGYYSRARNLQSAARIIAKEWGGRFPQTAREWAALPGVGRYTAGAIASIAFGERVAVLDGNVKRVLARVFAVREPIETAATLDALWRAAELLVPPRLPGEFNQALMELGARVCAPRSPRCAECPLRRQCDAHALKLEETLPMRKPKKPIPHHDIVAAAIRRDDDGAYLLGKRPPTSMLGGMWEFPGGKVEPGETHAQALARELLEELAIEVRVGGHLASVDHAYSHFRITLHVYACEWTGGQPHPKYHSELKWIAREDFSHYAMPAADIKFLDRLR